MEFLKGINFGSPRKSKTIKADSRDVIPTDGELKAETTNTLPKEVNCESTPNTEEQEGDDDDDLITNEIKRRLKELRRSNFMVLIPEESCPEEEEESSSSEWRESEVEEVYSWCGFDALYAKYCERMLFFDKIIAQKLRNPDYLNSSITSPRSTPKNLISSMRRFSFKKKNELREDEGEQLQLQPDDDGERECPNIETAYVAQICLTWETLHCQYTQVRQRISSQPEDFAFFGLATQQFQQFQVLLQRFIENEPFDRDSRVEIYARSRLMMPKLLQVPPLQGLERGDYEQDAVDNSHVLASDLMEAMEEAMLTFRNFLKMDKKRSSSGLYLNLFGAQKREVQNSLLHVQISLDKKEMKLKELFKRKRGLKKKMKNQEEIDLLFGLIDIKVISRVLRMNSLSKEQLLWCEEKMSKLELTELCLQREGSPVLFPC